MVNTNEAVISDQGKASGIALSLDGQTVYFVSDPAVVTACNVLSGTLKAMKNSVVSCQRRSSYYDHEWNCRIVEP